MFLIQIMLNSTTSSSSAKTSRVDVYPQSFKELPTCAIKMKHPCVMICIPEVILLIRTNAETLKESESF